MTRLERLYAPPEIGAPGQRQARQRRRDLRRSGLFVLAMLGIAVAAVVLVTPGLFAGAYRLHVYFDDAAGLEPGIPVIQDGYVIGLVDGVEAIFPGRDPDAQHCPAVDASRSSLLPCFRARLRIGQDWPIPRDSRARIGSAGLLQGSAIRIQPGEALESLGDGEALASAGREMDLLAQLGNLSDTLQILVDETIAPALASIQLQIRTIEGFIGVGDESGESQERLAGVFDSLQQLAARIESVVDAAQLGRILASVERMAENLGEASADLTGSSAEVQRTVREYGDLAGDLRRIVDRNRPALEGSLDDSQYVLQELAAALVPILANIDAATRDLSALARDLRANPAVILRGRPVEERPSWFD